MFVHVVLYTKHKIVFMMDHCTSHINTYSQRFSAHKGASLVCARIDRRLTLMLFENKYKKKKTTQIITVLLCIGNSHTWS